MAHSKSHSGRPARLWAGVVVGVVGAILSAGVRFVIVPAYCTQRADGTYGELYGPIHFAAPYAYGASAVLVIVGLLLVFSALQASRHVSATHA